MRYKILGHSGLRVSELCLGTMTFGSDDPWCADAAESKAMFNAYVEAGGNFIDTADIYTGGESERLVGQFVAGEREKFVVATKYSNAFPGNNDANAGGNQRKNFMQSLDASLKRMQLDYIDLYWVHNWEYITPVEEIMRAIDDAVSAGKILYAGFSDAPAWITARGNTLAERYGWSKFIALQLEYSLTERGIEREHMPMCRQLDIGITAWSPLASGILSGKYTRNKEDGKRLDTIAFHELDERKLAIARAVDQVADELGVSSARVALAWVRQRGTIPIIGARTLAQLQDNLASLDLTLGETHLDSLDSASAIEPGHPYDFLDKELVRLLAFGGMADLIDNHRPT